MQLPAKELLGLALFAFWAFIVCRGPPLFSLHPQIMHSIEDQNKYPKSWQAGALHKKIQIMTCHTHNENRMLQKIKNLLLLGLLFACCSKIW